jgi:hypothetical protein
MSNLQFGLILVILIYQCWQTSHASDGRFLKRRLEEIEGKLDAISPSPHYRDEAD